MLLGLQTRLLVRTYGTVSPNSQQTESRVALKVKLEAAQELRDLIDSIRDAESPRTFPHLLMGLFDTLRTTTPSFKRDSVEFQLRRVIVEIVHRISPTEAMRPQLNSMVNGILNILQNDTEDNAVTCLKVLHDLLRVMKNMSDEHSSELVQIFLHILRNAKGYVDEFLSKDSLTVDANVVIRSNRSLKVLTEIPIVLIILVQSSSRAALLPLLPEVIGASLEVCLLSVHALPGQLIFLLLSRRDLSSLRCKRRPEKPMNKWRITQFGLGRRQVSRIPDNMSTSSPHRSR